MLDIQEISLNMCILTIFYTLISYYPKLEKYDTEIKFSMYRSLMCVAFGSMGINVLINHIINGFSHPYAFKHNDMMEILQLFAAYLIVDLIQMVATKSTRIDLYAHHVLCLVGLVISHSTNRFGYLQSILLIAELLSVVSGIDSIALKENDMKLSYYCKKIRKNIIKYIRYPLWIVLLIVTIRYTNKTPTLLWYKGLIFAFTMIYLDKSWEEKCDKVIDKYENPL